MPKAVFVQDGTSIDYIPTTAVAAGDVVVQGDLVGIATQDIPANTLGALKVEGVFDVVKQSGAAISAGALVYWDATNQVATTSATGKLIGKCIKAAAAADATVRVKMSQ